MQDTTKDNRLPQMQQTVVWQQINRQQITGCVHDACNPNLPWTLTAEDRFPGNVMLLSVILRKMVDFHPLYLSHFPNLRTLNGYFTQVIRIVHSWIDVEQVCSGLPTEPLEDQVPDESLRCVCVVMLVFNSSIYIWILSITGIST